MKFVRRQNLGALEIIAHLDTGGMAEIYLARNRRGGFSVVKLLSERMREKPDLISMFEQEGRILTRLDHPNIVKVQGHGELDGLPYIAMEYLAGDHLGVLAKMAEKQDLVLSFPLIARIFLQVANGLAYVHEAEDESGRPLGLVHRDVSPPNIMICYDGRVKLLDFGVAWVDRKDRMTRTGLVKGKVHYMSPEQINAKPVDRRSDIFSVGIVMWEIVTGRDLADSDSDYGVMKQLCEEEIPPPSSFRLDLPEVLEAIIMRCLQRPPEQRFQSAAELRQMLSDYLFAGEDSGRPDDLLKITDQLLGERRKRKEIFIQSIQRESTLREDLFGDLDYEMKDSDSTEEVPQPEIVEAVAPPPSEESRASAKSLPLRPVLMVLVGLAVVSIIVWQILASGESGTPPNAVSPPPPAVEEKPSPQPESEPEPEPVDEPESAKPVPAPEEPGAEQPPPAQEPDPPAPEAEPQPEPEPPVVPEEKPPPENLGWLILDTKPQTEVWLKERYLGKTPIRDLPLRPGRYLLDLINKQAGIRKTFRVRIRKNQVTSHKIIY